MIRFNSILAIGVLSFLSLVTGCSQPQATRPTESSSPAVSSSASNSSAASSGFGALKTVIAKTNTAANAGDFKSAKVEFEKFEENWAKVENGVKAKSPKVYDQVEEGMDKVSKSLKAAQPQKETVTSALKTLEQTVTSASAL